MADATIYLRATRGDVMEHVVKVVSIMAGGAPDTLNVRMGVYMRIGNVLLSKIQQAFIVKSRGGTDEAGIKWRPLKRETIAQRRTSRRQLRELGVGGRRVRGLLTPAQDKRWRAIFRGVFLRLSTSIGPAAAKARAAQVAWATLKREGAKTKLEVLGGRQVDMLRDTGVLFNSLAAGVEDQPAQADGQVFETGDGFFIVGSSVAYARRQHSMRPLWPEPADIPASWWEAMGGAAARGVMRAVEVIA